jgi:hypothetical protein
VKELFRTYLSNLTGMEPQENNEKTVVLQDEGLRKLKEFVQIPKAVLLCKEISYGAKVAYSILLGYAWQDEFCFPAQESLANDLGCSVRQARRFLVELKECKFITWKQMGLNKPNVYYLLPLPVLQKKHSFKGSTKKSGWDIFVPSGPDIYVHTGAEVFVRSRSDKYVRLQILIYKQTK